MITDTFDNSSPPMIGPHMPSDLEGPVPATVIASFSEAVMDGIRKDYPGEKLCTLRSAGFRPLVERFSAQGHCLGRFLMPLGGPCAAALSEEMFFMGVKRMIFVGSCGRLTAGSSGDLILPEKAFRDEGTSYHYMPAGDWVNIPTAHALRRMLEGAGFACEMGPVWTTDAFYRETENTARKRREAGCVAVDMECASIFAAAQFHSWEVYQFFYTMDALLPTGWEQRTMGSLPENHAALAARAALTAAKAADI